MSSISDPLLLCKQPCISVRRNRVVRLGRYKGRKLEGMMTKLAARLGMSVEECHFCFTQLLLRYGWTGEEPADFDKEILAIHRLWIAGELPQPDYGSFITLFASWRVYDDPIGSGGYLDWDWMG